MEERRRVLPGLILIVLGILFLTFQSLGVGGESVVAVIGLVFLALYAYTGHYGSLVPGGIMTGLGVGVIVAARSPENGPAVLLGLGTGFLSIYALGARWRHTPGGWWPLIPGGVLTLIGLLLAAGQSGLLEAIGQWWPLVLILIGAYLLFRGRRGQPKA